MGLHGVSEAAVAEPGVREELFHQQTLRLVRSSLGTDCSGDTGWVTPSSSSSSTGDDEMRQHRVENWSVRVSHLLSHLEYITYEIKYII